MFRPTKQVYLDGAVASARFGYPVAVVGGAGEDEDEQVPGPGWEAVQEQGRAGQACRTGPSTSTSVTGRRLPCWTSRSRASAAPGWGEGRQRFVSGHPYLRGTAPSLTTLK